MKKKILGSIILFAAILSVIVIVWNRQNNVILSKSEEDRQKSMELSKDDEDGQEIVRLLENVDIETISDVAIYRPATYITITGQDDIKKVVDVLQSMKLQERQSLEKDGAFPVYIDYKNGDRVAYSFLAREITTGGKCYEPDRDYCGDIEALYNELSKKYPEEKN
ncbi:MAG: hypothetical protein K2K09_02265 [Lachnospiraceae bacterium]|nr:hypothetical protein [Lachnospiraceae bacterium]